MEPDTLEAARMGVTVHAAAADEAAAEGERGMLASDLLPWLRRLVN
jgi:NAD(P)H-hydrate epimerase